MSKNTFAPLSTDTGKSFKKHNGCRPEFSRSSTTLADLVGEYEASQKNCEKKWNPLRSLLEGYRKLDDLEMAIKSAALAEDIVGQSYQKDWTGKVKRHGHQRRIKQMALQEARRILSSKSKIVELKNCKSFDEIFRFVTRNCSSIQGIGPLYIYDTALRIGAFSKKLPAQVHLQAGALAGARALGLDVKSSPLPVSNFPKPMQLLDPHEIEDFLCIYKDQLAKFEI